MNKRVMVVYSDAPEVGPYEAAVRAGGMEPVLVLAGSRPSLDGCAGVLLTGGCDVNPRCYGEQCHPETEEPDDERDSAEHSLLTAALERDMPILAICRGLQVWNVHHGGTLIQHLDSVTRHRISPEDKSEPAHEVVIEPGTLLASIAGSRTLCVNSRHHQAIGKLGAGLTVSARDAEDGTIEAVERADKRFALAVQWHPENQVFRHPEQLRLFTAFAAALG